MPFKVYCNSSNTTVLSPLSAYTAVKSETISQDNTDNEDFQDIFQQLKGSLNLKYVNLTLPKTAVIMCGIQSLTL